jgi:hypothetical protein
MLKHIQSLEPALADAIAPGLETLGDPIRFDSFRFASGDLASRFFGVPLLEVVDTLSDKLVDDLQRDVHLKSEHVPSSGLSGIRIITENPNAPIRLKVVAFANSFFERGASPSAMSWWCKALFSEFHFIWSSALDISYVKAEAPDLVICQTVERFLSSLPQS